MTCHHDRNDPSCSSHPSNVAERAREREREVQAEITAKREARKAEEYAKTPDNTRYEIAQFERIGKHVVLKVLYPNCVKCSYEGNKVMVFLNVTEADMIKWRIIDPHFQNPKTVRAPNEAPSPAGRFPASTEGWLDAVNYARSKA